MSSTITNLISIATYGYEYSYTSADTAVFGGIMAFFATYSLIILGVSVLMLISNWKIFTKAGKPGWATIVPFYNIYVQTEIAGLPIMYFIFTFIPFLNIYAIFKIYIEIAHKFGKSTGFGIGMIFLNVIFIPMLAFGNSKYLGNTNTNYNMNNGPTGYDPVTGQPIYGNQNFNMNTTTTNMTGQPQQPQQPQTNTFVQNDTPVQTNNVVEAPHIETPDMGPIDENNQNPQ